MCPGTASGIGTPAPPTVRMRSARRVARTCRPPNSAQGRPREAHTCASTPRRATSRGEGPTRRSRRRARHPPSRTCSHLSHRTRSQPSHRTRARGRRKPRCASRHPRPQCSRGSRRRSSVDRRTRTRRGRPSRRATRACTLTLPAIVRTSRRASRSTASRFFSSLSLRATFRGEEPPRVVCDAPGDRGSLERAQYARGMVRPSASR